MQAPTDNRDVAIAIAPDPLDQLVKRVRVGGIEPLRVDRRLFRLSHAALAGSSGMA